MISPIKTVSSIGIPLAIQQCGLLLGVLLLALVAGLVRKSAVMLIECGLKNQKCNMENLSEHLLGPFGYYLAVGSMFLYAYGGQIAYLIIVGDTLPTVLRLILPSSVAILYNRQFIIGIFGVFIILPLCLLRDMGKLEWTSFLSISADIILIIVVLVASFSASQNQNEHFHMNNFADVTPSLFAGIGTMSFAFVCQHNSFLVFQTLKKPTVSEWSIVANISIAFSYFLCLLLGLIGFFAFFPYVQGDLLNNFPVGYVEISVARALLGLSMLFTYPMESFVSRHCLLTVYRRLREKQENSQSSFQLKNEIEMTATSNTLHVNGRSTIDEADIEEQTVDFQTPNRKKLERNDKRDNKPKNKYMLVNQRFFSDEKEDEESRSRDNNDDDEEVIDFHNPSTLSSDAEGRHEKTSNHEFSRLELTVSTLLLWGTTLSISLLFEKLGVVSALTGVLAASNIGYTLPALIYIKTYYHEFLLLFNNIFLIDNPMVVVTSEDEHQTSHSQFTTRRIISRMYSTILMINLTSFKIFISKFGVPLFMLVFGVIVLVIGVTTILVDQIYGN